jgi:hypothetical protein
MNYGLSRTHIIVLIESSSSSLRFIILVVLVFLGKFLLLSRHKYIRCIAKEMYLERSK